jgi:hypothetical protein
MTQALEIDLLLAGKYYSTNLSRLNFFRQRMAYRSRRKTGIRILKSGRIPLSAVGCLGSLRGSHAGHKTSLLAQLIFPVPSFAHAFLAAGSSNSVWNARLVSGNSSALEEECKSSDGNEANVCPWHGFGDASSPKNIGNLVTIQGKSFIVAIKIWN